jgi:hypothetical protein
MMSNDWSKFAGDSRKGKTFDGRFTQSVQRLIYFGQEVGGGW